MEREYETYFIIPRNDLYSGFFTIFGCVDVDGTGCVEEDGTGCVEEEVDPEPC